MPVHRQLGLRIEVAETARREAGEILPQDGFQFSRGQIDDDHVSDREKRALSCADKAECRKIEAVAQQRGGQYFPVILTCDVEENQRRIVSPERSANLKSIDPNEPDRLHKTTRLLSFDGHPNRIQLDVTHTQPAEAAKRILQEAGRTRTNTATVKATEFRP